ncbi:hypothetical protein ACXJJ3_42060 (plasmid) [Kribbella sp. WER1]
MNAESPAYADPAAGRRRRLLLLVVLPIVLFVGTGLLVFFLLTNRAEQHTVDRRDETAIAYVNAINVGDPATVCRLETERQRDASQEACEKDRAYLKDRNVKADEPKVVTTKDFAEGVGVLVEYHLTTGGSTPSRDALRMMKQPDGSWLVDQAEDANSDDMATGDPLGTTLGERRGAS